jgi:hypothetical protein
MTAAIAITALLLCVATIVGSVLVACVRMADLQDEMRD